MEGHRMSTPDRTETIVKRDSQIHSCTATQYRYTLHVPRCLNDGTDVHPNLIADIECQLRATFGAFTRTEAIGVWSDDDTIYEDSQYLYLIDCVSEQCGHQLREIAARVRNDLSQECVYVTCQQITTWLV
jgi:hypothetical protein